MESELNLPKQIEFIIITFESTKYPYPRTIAFPSSGTSQISTSYFSVFPGIYHLTSISRYFPPRREILVFPGKSLKKLNMII